MKEFMMAVLFVAGVSALGFVASAQVNDPGTGGTHPMLERLDSNQDGNITQDEIAAGQSERFASADANGDGAVSVAEFEAAREARRQERQNRRAQRMFARLDTNGDGLISAEEHEAHAASRTERRMARIDTDGDGVLSSAELEAAQNSRQERRKRRHGDRHQQ